MPVRHHGNARADVLQGARADLEALLLQIAERERLTPAECVSILTLLCHQQARTVLRLEAEAAAHPVTAAAAH